jgi:hypothetical protein
MTIQQAIPASDGPAAPAEAGGLKSGDIVNYRLSLLQRIGAANVEWLEGPHEAKRYTIEDLKAVKASYRAMTRELKGAAA